MFIIYFQATKGRALSFDTGPRFRVNIYRGILQKKHVRI